MSNAQRLVCLRHKIHVCVCVPVSVSVPVCALCVCVCVCVCRADAVSNEEWLRLFRILRERQAGAQRAITVIPTHL